MPCREKSSIGDCLRLLRGELLSDGLSNVEATIFQCLTNPRIALFARAIVRGNCSLVFILGGSELRDISLSAELA